MRPIDADALMRCLTTIERLARSDAQQALLGRVYYIVSKQTTIQSDEPRVMTLDEARNVEVVWAEDRSTRAIYPYIVKNDMNDSKLYKYGVQWRCWTSRPAEEQREAVKWE